MTRLISRHRCLATLASTGFLLCLEIVYLGNVSLWSLGFGTVSVDATITAAGREYEATYSTLNGPSENGSRPLLSMVLIANSPQLLLTFLYFLYNSIYTSMFAAFEWSRFALHKKALRVSSPKGSQRSTYWPQLPWTYSLPLTVASAVLHWLVSQSIFLVKIDTFNPRHELTPRQNISTCGYSPYALIITIIVAGIMLIALILVGLRRLDTKMPSAGSNSLAISAACHRPIGDNDADIMPVRWGAISHETVDGPGHCCITSFDVEDPIEGQRYK